jgi:hypothetical protein
MIDEDDFWRIGGMETGRGNRNTRRKPTPAPLCPPQNPTWQTWSRTPDRSCGKPATNRLSYGAAFLSPFRRLLRLAGSRWSYSTPPPHEFPITVTTTIIITTRITNSRSGFSSSNTSSSSRVAVELAIHNSMLALGNFMTCRFQNSLSCLPFISLSPLVLLVYKPLVSTNSICMALASLSIYINLFRLYLMNRLLHCFSLRFLLLQER